MRHGFDNKFQNALKCDMVSTTCSKPTKPTNLPSYQPSNLHLYLYLFLVHAQHSCACTTLLCMHWRGQGPRPGPNKKSAGVRPAQECCVCARILCVHKNLVHAQYTVLFLQNNKHCSETFPYQRSDFLVHLQLHSRLRRIQ